MRRWHVWVYFDETVEAEDQLDAEMMLQPAIERAIRSEEVEPEEEENV